MLPDTATRERIVSISLLSAAVAAACAVALPLIGSSQLDYRGALKGVSPQREIPWHIRVPPALLAILAGGWLAIAGLLFQALLRDALATPYTLGGYRAGLRSAPSRPLHSAGV